MKVLQIYIYKGKCTEYRGSEMTVLPTVIEALTGQGYRTYK